MGTSAASPAPRETPGAQPGSLVVSESVQEAEWDRFVQAHPDATVDHLWPWRAVFGGVFGHESRYLVARRGAAVAGVLPLVVFRSRLFGRFLISLPFLNYGGVLADDDDCAAALVGHAADLARSIRASHVELRHRARRLPGLPVRRHKLALTRPLPRSTDVLWAELDRKVRNQVRKAQKDGLTASTGGAELLPEFYGVFARNMRDLGTPVYPRRLFEEVLRQFPGISRVTIVRRAERAVAGAVTLAWRGMVLVPWASSLRAYRQHCPNMLLYWTLLEEAVRGGASVFDFGRSSEGSGTHHFKAQWGAQAAPLHWEYVLLARRAAPDQGPTNPRFAPAIAAWQRLPLWIANALGPAIVRNIP